MEKNKKNNHEKLTAMREGGKLLAEVKKELLQSLKIGQSLAEIDQKARELIEATGAETNFDMEPDYYWATCLNLNEGICHGIPHEDIKIKEGDLLKIDIGLKWKGYHLDSSETVIIGKDINNYTSMLEAGRVAQKKAMAEAMAGKSVYDISHAMEKYLTKRGYEMVYQLTGHGVGAELHEDPYIPCVARRCDKNEVLTEGQTLAIEIMFAAGDAYLVEADDGWTFATEDGSPTILLEETVIVHAGRPPEILTAIE